MTRTAMARPASRTAASTPDASRRAVIQDRPERRAVQSVEVGSRLLLALADQPGSMTLKDLAAAADLPASRAHPYLVSYARMQLVEQDASSGRYALGPAARRIGLAALRQWDPLKAATSMAERLAAETGHAAALAVWGSHGPTIVRMVEARQPLHVAMRVGHVMSVLGTATGRAFMAVLPAERLREALVGPLGEWRERRAPAVQRGLAQARREAVAEWTAHGVMRAEGRPIPSVNAFSAPVFGPDGEVALVITLLDQDDRLTADSCGPAAGLLRAAASELSLALPAPVSG